MKLPFVLIPSLVIFKRSLIYKDGDIFEKFNTSNDIGYGDDTEFFLKIIKNSNYCFVDSPLVFYREHNESITENAIATGEAPKLHCKMLDKWIRGESIVTFTRMERYWIMSTDYIRIMNEVTSSDSRRELLKKEFTRIEKIFVIFRKISHILLPCKVKALIKEKIL